MNIANSDINKPQNPFMVHREGVIDGDVLRINAGLWRRFANLLIDEICIVLFGLILVKLLQLTLFVQLPGYEFSTLMEDLPVFKSWLTIRLVYFIVLERSFGRTIGKLFSRTRVVDELGGVPILRRLLVRTLCRFVPFEFISIYFSAEKRSWHDVVSGTRVITTHI